jgi:hypothetical protein
MTVLGYAAVFSFVVNDLVKVYLLKRWPIEKA